MDKPVHLYVKTHNVTGLKYFGPTAENPETYLGSGAYWRSHLAEYGDNVTTEVVGTYVDEAQLRAACDSFSTENDIVNSVEWANLIPESGMPGEGWKPGHDYSDVDRSRLGGHRGGEFPVIGGELEHGIDPSELY